MVPSSVKEDMTNSINGIIILIEIMVKIIYATICIGSDFLVLILLILLILSYSHTLILFG